MSSPIRKDLQHLAEPWDNAGGLLHIVAEILEALRPQIAGNTSGRAVQGAGRGVRMRGPVCAEVPPATGPDHFALDQLLGLEHSSATTPGTAMTAALIPIRRTQTRRVAVRRRSS